MYEMNEHKIITSPGKFEGEMYYIPELWDLVLDGFSDFDLDDPMIDSPISFFRIDQELLDKYPELAEFEGILFLALWENDSGFVFSQEITTGNIDQLSRDFLNELREYL